LTGQGNARRRRKTGASSISCSRDRTMLIRTVTAKRSLQSSHRTQRSGWVLIFSVISVLSVLIVSVFAAPQPKLTGGTGTLFLGGWPNKIYVIDEATEKVTGAIDMASGDPTRMVLSRDRKRFYVVNSLSQEVEIVDSAARRSIEHFTKSASS